MKQRELGQMRLLYCILLMSAYFFTTVSLYAESEFDISALRKELAEISVSAEKGEENFESKNALLEQKELQLLRQLEETPVEDNVEATATLPEPPKALNNRESARASLGDEKDIELETEVTEETSSTPAPVEELRHARIEDLPITEEKEIAPEIPALSNEQLKILEEKLLASEQAKKDAVKKEANTKTELAKLKATVSDLERKNARLNSQLLLAETEVTRLAQELNRQMKLPSQVTTTAKDSNTPQDIDTTSSSHNNSRVKYPTNSQTHRDSDSSMIATVTAPKANLRSGPGTNNAPIMQVSKGTRLLVETRQGSWYRVVSPSGSRAWISGEVIAFGASGSRSPSGTLSISAIRNIGSQ